MITHTLKILPKYFKEIVNENKTFEVRKNDRKYHVGDVLILKEFNKDLFTGQYVVAKITYILDDIEYLQPGYVILAIKLLK